MDCCCDHSAAGDIFGSLLFDTSRWAAQMTLQFFDAKPYYETEPIRELMLQALPAPNDEVLERIMQRYHDDDRLRLVGALDEAENVQGIIGLRLDEDNAATILHLRSGTESNSEETSGALVRAIIRIYKLQLLNARSHQQNLGMYESLGFISWVVGEKPPGTKWYGVRWERGGEGGRIMNYEL